MGQPASQHDFSFCYHSFITIIILHNIVFFSTQFDRLFVWYDEMTLNIKEEINEWAYLLYCNILYLLASHNNDNMVII